MKLLTLIIVAFLSTSFASTLENIQSDIQVLNTDLTHIDQQIADLRKEERGLKDHDGFVAGIVTTRKIQVDPKTQKVNERIVEIQDQVKKLKSVRKVTQDQLNRFRQEERAEERKIAQERAAVERERVKTERAERDRRALEERELNFLKQKLRRIDVESDLSKIDYDTLSAETELAELKSAYDKSLLGAYLQEKMAMLLESNVMCESINSCQGGTNPKSVDKFNKKLRDQVFPNAQVRESQSPTRPSDAR